jgi:hypothetical protein
MTYQVRPFVASDAAPWDAFCEASLQATFLHSRRFLSYHGDRFEDQSLVIEQEGHWAGVFPAAAHPGDASCVVSHPGITYGGIAHQGELRGERMLLALAEICRHFENQGRKKLLYKAVPVFYHRGPAQDDIYALYRFGAQRIRCDLSCAIDLQNRLEVSSRRRRSLRKAVKCGVELSDDAQLLPQLWDVVIDNLARKHGVKPVHVIGEIQALMGSLPENIRCVCAVRDDIVIAGVLLFITATTYHAQYIAASDVGYETSALDLVFERCIADAQAAGKRWFDFGVSTEADGMTLNENLYRFKSEFGGAGMVHEFFELNVSRR